MSAFASVEQENEALAAEIARLADENARLLQAGLQRKHQMLMEENARLKAAPAAGLADAPPGLSSVTPPGLVTLPTRLDWDPVAAANNAMLSMASAQHAKLSGAWPYAGMSTVSPASDTGSLYSSFASSMASSSLSASILNASGEVGDFDPLQPKTTLMLRNLPNSYSRDMLLELLDTHGFNAKYNLVYLPIDFSTRAGFGYAFVNYVDEASAMLCMTELQGFREWPMPSEKVLDAMWSSAHQGFESHVERYRNSPVMHDSVADELKPAIFVNGRRVTFPRPTKKLRAPRLRQ